MGHQVFGTRVVYRETFLQIQRRLLQHPICKSHIHGVLIYQNQFTHYRQKRVRNQTPVQEQRCQSGPSAGNSVVHSEGKISNNYGADQQRLPISDPHFDKFPTSATFACWKWRFKTKVCTCSQFHTEAMLWIKEVEMVDSVDDLRSNEDVRGIRMPDFEVLDARIASALNRIIHNFHFKRMVSLEEQTAPKVDRDLCRLLFDCSSKWSGIRLKVGRNFVAMTKIPPDDILEGLYKLRIRESEKLKTVLELYDLEIHQKKAGFDYHRLKTMMKRSIEQDLRNRNLGYQKRKIWDKRRCQESGDKTAWTQNSRRLLAVESQRAVF